MINIALVDNNESRALSVIDLLTEVNLVSRFSSFDSIVNEQQKNGPWDIILCDSQLSNHDIKRLVDYFSSEKIPVLVFIESGQEHQIPELINVGVAEVIEKPVKSQTLIHRIEVQLRLKDQITRLGKLEDQLIQSEKLAALGQLTAGVAHEINNPVGFVSSNMNLIERYLKKITEELDSLKRNCDEETTGAGVLLFATWSASSKLNEYMTSLKELADESSEGLSRVRDIVKDLKDYSHVGELKFEFSDINAMLKSSVNLLRNEIKYKAEVIFELEPCPPVECIVSQLGQVFVNIIVNACHAIESAGQIKISTKLIETNLVIEISDTGKGIDAEIVEKIFDPFFTTKPIGKGTGIGLSITHSIIERHNGSVAVASVVGKGTTFTIQLPLQQPELP